MVSRSLSGQRGLLNTLWSGFEVSHWFIFVICLFKYRKNKCMLWLGLVLLWAQRNQCAEGEKAAESRSLFSLFTLPPTSLAANQFTSDYLIWNVAFNLSNPAALRMKINHPVWSFKAPHLFSTEARFSQREKLFFFFKFCTTLLVYHYYVKSRASKSQ